MKRTYKWLAVGVSVALLAPVAAAIAAGPTIPPVTIPALPVTLPVTLPTTVPTLPITPPDPAVALDVLQGQIELIAAALGQTPDDLLSRVLATEIPSSGSLVLTVNDLLSRLAGTPIFMPDSAGILGTTEIAIGDISHAFNMSVQQPATVGPKCLEATTIDPCPAAPNPNVAQLPTYSMVSSNWVPALPANPAENVPGTSNLVVQLLVGLAVGLAGTATALVPGIPAGLVPVAGLTSSTGKVNLAAPATVCTTTPLPVAICQAIMAMIKTNSTLIAGGHGRLVNIQGAGFVVDGVKKGLHNGGTGPSNGSNVDTALRQPTVFGDPSISLIKDPFPIWLPLVTATTVLPDSNVDFLGFSAGGISPDNRKCVANKVGGVTPAPTPAPDGPNGEAQVTFPASTCTSSGKFSGLGIALYGAAPIDFRQDLAPLWTPAPVALDAVNNAITAAIQTVTASSPSTLAVLIFALGAAGLVPLSSVTPILSGTLPTIPGGGSLPIDLSTLPIGALPLGLP